MTTPAIRKRTAPRVAAGRCSTAMRIARYVEPQKKYTSKNETAMRKRCWRSRGVMFSLGAKAYEIYCASPMIQKFLRYVYLFLALETKSRQPSGENWRPA